MRPASAAGEHVEVVLGRVLRSDPACGRGFEQRLVPGRVGTFLDPDAGHVAAVGSEHGENRVAAVDCFADESLCEGEYAALAPVRLLLVVAGLPPVQPDFQTG